MSLKESDLRGVFTALLVRRERRIQRAEAAIAKARLEEVKSSSNEIITRAASLHEDAKAKRARGRSAWDDAVMPALDKLAAATAAEDTDAMRASIDALSYGLGVTSAVPADDDVLEALVDSSRPMKIGKAGAAPPSPSAVRLLERLGPQVEPPNAWNAAFDWTAGTRDVPYDPPLAGTQLARPGAFGVAYDHHGVLLEDGTVVHFNGEAGNKRDARIRRVTLEDFLNGESVAAVQAVVPERVRSRRVTGLRPAIVTLRALMDIGRGDYAFLSDNCEHFANWAGLGASHSSQTRLATQVRRLVEACPPVEPFVVELLERDVALTRRAITPPSTQRTETIILDLGRAFWSPDAEDVVLHLPFWSSPESAPAAADHAWRLGALSGTLTPGSWASANPATFVESERYWSLVAVVDGAWNDVKGTQGLYWVSSDGTWRREARAPEDLFPSRLHYSDTLFEALGASAVETLGKVARLFNSSA